MAEKKVIVINNLVLANKTRLEVRINQLEHNNRILNHNSLVKRYRNESNPENIQSIDSELKVISILSQLDVRIDCAGERLPNGKRTDAVILQNTGKIFTEVFYFWREKEIFLEEFNKTRTATINPITFIRERVKEKYYGNAGKCQFSNDTPHILIIDLTHSIADEFRLKHVVSDFSKAFSCESLPYGYSGIFHERSHNDCFDYENISAAIALKDEHITEMITNPNARNVLPDEFILQIKPLCDHFQ